MRSKTLILTSLVVVAIVALAVAVAVAGAGKSEPLPAITAPELLAKMAGGGNVTAVSGDITWNNGLFGDIAQAAPMAHGAAQSPLTGSGSGRLWVSDAGARVESQSGGGDQVLVLNTAQHTAWIYDYAQNTAEKIQTTGTPPAGASSPAGTPLSGAAAGMSSPVPTMTVPTPQSISLYLEHIARFATVEIAGQANVAGRSVYQLRLTPVADDTALGSIQAAIDGKTMLPLQVQVYAKGAAKPVISFGFTSVSYGAIDPGTFSFAPPSGTKVTTKTIDMNKVRAELQKAKETQRGTKPSATQKAKAHDLVQRASLTRAQVAKLVPFQLAYARSYTARPFEHGAVLGPRGPLTATGTPLLQALGAVTGMSVPAPMSGAQPAPKGAGSVATQLGPSSVLVYGQGFGTIVLGQTKTTPELQQQLGQARKTSQILGTTTVNGARAIEVGTPLGGVIVWQQGDTTLAAGGMVTMQDLEAFVSSVR